MSHVCIRTAFFYKNVAPNYIKIVKSEKKCKIICKNKKINVILQKFYILSIRF